jgi:hypothetical protein
MIVEVPVSVGKPPITAPSEATFVGTPMPACPGPAFAFAPVAAVVAEVRSSAGNLPAWSACGVSWRSYTMLSKSARWMAGANRRMRSPSWPLGLHGLRLWRRFFVCLFGHCRQWRYCKNRHQRNGYHQQSRLGHNCCPLLAGLKRLPGFQHQIIVTQWPRNKKAPRWFRGAQGEKALCVGWRFHLLPRSSPPSIARQCYGVQRIELVGRCGASATVSREARQQEKGGRSRPAVVECGRPKREASFSTFGQY